MQQSLSPRNVGLDAARSIAIVLVLLSHGSKYFPPEWVAINPDAFWALGVLGVELFYALSGFLIGGLLLEIQASAPTLGSLGRFMARRWMRTLPLYYFVLCAFLVFPFLEPNRHASVASYFIMGQNLFAPMQGIWYGPSWSLVIEEWSYLLLPFLAFCLFGSLRHAVAVAALALCCVGLIERGILSNPLHDWDESIRKVYLMRLDAIAYGVLAACLFRNPLNKDSVRRWVVRLAPVNVALIGLSFWLCAARHSHPEYLPSFFGRVILLTTTGIGFAGLVLLAPSWNIRGWLIPPVRFVSKISYALYLVHWPLLFMLDDVPFALRFVTFAVASIASASLLSYGLEQPIMRLRPKPFGG